MYFKNEKSRTITTKVILGDEDHKEVEVTLRINPSSNECIIEFSTGYIPDSTKIVKSILALKKEKEYKNYIYIYSFNSSYTSEQKETIKKSLLVFKIKTIG